MPPVYEAFHTLHTDRYLAYARAHLDDAAAQAAVQSALGTIATHWPYIVAQAHPAAIAWEQLVATTGSRTHPLPADTTSPLHYDALILHTLGYTAHSIAEATGTHPTTVHCLLHPHKREHHDPT
ncbi:hypothetical protein GCM10010232_68220 [Streptomyces amakusaensis]